MIRLPVITAALVLAGGLSQFATPLAISAQDAGMIRAHATVVPAEAAWEAHRAGLQLAGEAGAVEAGGTIRGARWIRDDGGEATQVRRTLPSFDDAPSGGAAGTGEHPEVPTGPAAGEGVLASVNQRTADPERPAGTRDVRITIAHVAY